MLDLPKALTVGVFILFGAIANAADGGTDVQNNQNGRDNFQSAFERLKSLEGVWDEAAWSEEGGGRRVVEYRITGRGTALIEEYHGEPPMTTVYHMDGDILRMTHYCNAGNQPRMSSSWYRDNSIQFDFVDVTNLSAPHAYHTRTLRVEFLDEDHVDLHFVGLKNGEDVPGTVSLTRRR